MVWHHGTKIKDALSWEASCGRPLGNLSFGVAFVPFGPWTNCNSSKCSYFLGCVGHKGDEHAVPICLLLHHRQAPCPVQRQDVGLKKFQTYLLEASLLPLFYFIIFQNVFI